MVKKRRRRIRIKRKNHSDSNSGINDELMTVNISGLRY